MKYKLKLITFCPLAYKIVNGDLLLLGHNYGKFFLISGMKKVVNF